MKIIVCPKCKRKLKKTNRFLVCKKCKLAYPISTEDVPNLLIQEAWSLEKAKKKRFRHRLKL